LKNAAATSGFMMLSMSSVQVVMQVSYTVAVRGEEGTGYLAN
jgi:transcriptional regulator with GAF, ATPase, and Fis domain